MWLLTVSGMKKTQLALYIETFEGVLLEPL
jgi:hypothetical protein